MDTVGLSLIMEWQPSDTDRAREGTTSLWRTHGDQNGERRDTSEWREKQESLLECVALTKWPLSPPKTRENKKRHFSDKFHLFLWNKDSCSFLFFCWSVILLKPIMEKAHLSEENSYSLTFQHNKSTWPCENVQADRLRQLKTFSILQFNQKMSSSWYFTLRHEILLYSYFATTASKIPSGLKWGENNLGSTAPGRLKKSVKGPGGDCCWNFISYTREYFWTILPPVDVTPRTQTFPSLWISQLNSPDKGK